ncbi:hypothetical protein BJY52DRAFT_1220102 [Lactarius psammicola]|nr:hypothetical protein BJY52DRAFT_1220102 [Lactarius psammicola]
MSAAVHNTTPMQRLALGALSLACAAGKLRKGWQALQDQWVLASVSGQLDANQLTNLVEVGAPHNKVVTGSPFQDVSIILHVFAELAFEAAYRNKTEKKKRERQLDAAAARKVRTRIQHDASTQVK